MHGFSTGYLGLNAEPWAYRDIRHKYERLKCLLFDTYVARFRAAQAEQSVENARIRALLADQGQLRRGDVRARKPAAA